MINPSNGAKSSQQSLFSQGFRSIWRHSSLSGFYGLLAIFLFGGLAIGFPIWLRTRNNSYDLNLTAGFEDGIYYPLAQAISKLVAEQHPHIRIHVFQSLGSRQNVERLLSKRNNFHLAIAQNDTGWSPRNLDESLPELLPGDSSVLRTLTPLYDDTFHILTRTEERLRSLSDLKSLQLAIGPKRSGSRPITDQLFAHYGLKLDPQNTLELPFKEAVEAFRERRADALLYMVGMHTKALSEALTHENCHFLSIGQSVQAESELGSFLLHYPFAKACTIPRMAYGMGPKGPIPQEPVHAIAVKNLLLAKSDLPHQVALQITQTILTNRSSLARQFPVAAQISESFDRDQLQYPLHRGAELFFARHQPGWLAQNAELIGVLLSLFAGSIGAIAAGRKWWVQRLKDRLDVDYLRLNQLLHRLRTETLGQEDLHWIRDEVATIRSEAYHLLTKELLLPDLSFQIFQVVLSDCENALRERGAYPGF